mgnify:CR=1 FL=1
MLIGQSPYEYFYADVLGDSQRQVLVECGSLRVHVLRIIRHTLDGGLHGTAIQGLVGDSGTDPNAQGTTTESTRIEIDPADGAQTCVQVSLVRADRQMSENPMIACAAKP